MPYLAGAVVVIGAIGLLNLILTLGVIKRLREQAATDAGGDGTPAVLAAGAVIGDFSATSTDGRLIAPGHFEPGAIVGFFSPSCKPCKEVAPIFADYSSTLLASQKKVFAVVVGGRDDASELISLLSPAATVITAERGEPIVTAFAADGFPALYLMGDEGRVMASGHSMDVLPERVLT